VNTITLGRGTYRLFEAEEHDPMDGVTGLPSITTMPKMPPLPPNNVTIIGRGPGLTHIRRDDNSLELFRIFHIARGHTLTLDGLSVENGFAQSSGLLGGQGGGILNEGTLTLRNVVIEQNSAGNAGGGIYNQGDAVTITNSILRRNFAFNDGGGIHIADGTLTIADSVLDENEAGHGQIGEGGGIWVTSSLGKAVAVTIANSTLRKNAAVRDGGGIRTRAPLTITNSTLSENHAGRKGGGIVAVGQEPVVTIASSTLSNNHVHGIPLGNGTKTVGGGGISIQEASVTIRNSTLSGNSADTGGFLNVNAVGGGIRSSANSGFGSTFKPIIITNSTLSGNDAENGGDNIFSAVEGPMPPTAGTIAIRNSIVANGEHDNCRVEVGGSTIDDKGNNIDTDGTCFDAAKGSFPGMDPMLDPAGLQDNGGLTQTIGLLSASLAIDRADNTVCGVPPLDNAPPLNIDPRGFVRPVGASCDIGAFEVGGMPPMDITSLLQQTIAVSPRQYQDIADCPAGTVRKSIFTKRLTNRRTNPVAVYDLMLKVVNIADGDVIQNADPGPDGLGAILTVPHTGQYSDEILRAGESVGVPVVICRTSAGLSGGLPSTNVLGLSLTP
jgi:hypothetical protein